MGCSMEIPNDTILFISGVSCVGKTTIAYEIIKEYNIFRRVSEIDILRTAIRSAYECFAEELCVNKQVLLNRYYSLFQSITNSDYETTKEQSIEMMPYVKEIVIRQQRRNIPTIIEGAGIVPSTYFPNGSPLEWLTNHMVFVNLFISDEKEHLNRRCSRVHNRNYSEDINKSKELITKARTEKNNILHTETTMLHQIFDNIISIDVSNIDIHETSCIIMELLSRYFSNIS